MYNLCLPEVVYMIFYFTLSTKIIKKCKKRYFLCLRHNFSGQCHERWFIEIRKINVAIETVG